MSQGTLIDVPPHRGNPDPNQRYTIRRALDWCRRKAGVTDYDLDAAACIEAHHAPLWYGPEQTFLKNRDGLSAPWFGDVFCNPPWDVIDQWCLKAWREFSTEADRVRNTEGLPTLISVSMLLPGDRTHRPWWQEYVEPFREFVRRDATALLRVHFPPERFPYGCPGNPEGIGTAEPNFTSVLLVWRTP